MRIHSSENIAFSTNRTQRNATDMEKTLMKLSTGSKVATASQSASGLAISETMRAQIKGLSQAQRNMQDGLSVLELSNEGLNNINDLLQRGREMAVAAANDTLTDDDRKSSTMELDQIMQAINDTAGKLEFNTMKILGGDNPLNLQVGANPGQKMTIGDIDVSTSALGLDGASIATRQDASELISTLDKAIETISGQLTKVGSEMSGIEHHLENALVFEGNITQSLSMLADTDMAKEMMNFVQQDIRQKGDQMLIKSVNNNLQDAVSLLK
ncbi:flagellin [Sporosarcina sp. PTS2304]|uniref:flagellin n=1 Tax=Sporosarcina sp. PTS2304 TaxID=2283194 RepID=UPI000E0D2C3E|nr:flagellin [Sporosarcina sp. PTS2304]AXH98408.1 flagellin [Sporosarcina sp. PTS2304]